tara:strand:- start:7005 stop:8456 length:1452 start_codon:yes stop_codon:yes gene_type:complete
MVVKKTDKKQDEEITNLKKKLKELSKKFLKKKKKETKDPKKFKKIKERLQKRQESNNANDLKSLLSMLGTSIQKSTGQPIQQALNPTQIGTTASRILKGELEKNIKGDPLKDYSNLKSSLINVKDKYNNNTLSVEDINNLYDKAKDFSSSVQQNLPSKEQLITMYGTGRLAYDYFMRFINRNRPSNTNPVNVNQPQPSNQPPTPSPPPPQSPPTQTNQEQPQQEQSQQEQPQQEQQRQSYTDYLTNMMPSMKMGIGLGALASGGLVLRNRLRGRRINRDIEVARDELAVRGLGQAVGNVGRELVRRNLEARNDIQDNINNLEQEQERTDMFSKALRRQREQQGTSEVSRERPPLREQQLERQTRMEYGQADLDGLRKTKSDGDLFRSPAKEQTRVRRASEPAPRGRIGKKEMQAMKEGEEFVERGTVATPIDPSRLQPREPAEFRVQLEGNIQDLRRALGSDLQEQEDIPAGTTFPDFDIETN